MPRGKDLVSARVRAMHGYTPGEQPSGGKLIKRFAITQVPAIVRQEGKRLRIDELRY